MMSPQARTQILLLAMVAGLAVLAHRAQLWTDAARFSAAEAESAWILPNPPTIRAASLGFQQPVGDLMWVRAVLVFVDIYESHDREGTRWLRGMLEASATLDPHWPSPLRWGGGMLRVCDDIESSDAIYALGARLFPDEPYFPFSLAMNAYLVHRDEVAAAEYLHRAALLPRAPKWYRAAAAGVMAEHGRRAAAIRYLEEQIAGTSDTRIVQASRQKLNRLIYEDRQDELERRRDAYRQETGHDIVSVDALAPLPQDPWGGRWFVGTDDRIVSTVADTRDAADDQKAERNRLASRWPADWNLSPIEEE